MTIKKRITTYNYHCIVYKDNCMYEETIISYEPITRKQVIIRLLEKGLNLLNLRTTQESQTFACSVEDFLKVAKPIEGKQ